MRRNADALESGFSLERAELDWDGHTFRDCLPAGESSALGWIHCSKFPRGAVDHLADRGLARVGREGELDRHCGRPENWVGLHPALAGAYMTALATRVSGSTYAEPLTDQHDLRAATPNDDDEPTISQTPNAGTPVVSRSTVVAMKWWRLPSLKWGIMSPPPEAAVHLKA